MKILGFSKQFESVKKAAESTLKSIFPIKGRSHTLRADRIWIEDNLDYNDFESQKKAKLNDRTWGVPVYADLSLVENSGRKIIDREKRIRIFTLPKYTPRASFIVKGNEYQFNNQIRLRPGVYTTRAKNDRITTFVNTGKGENFKLALNPETGIFTVEVHAGKAKLYPILKGLGISDSLIRQKWGNELFETNAQVTNEDVKKELNKVSKSFRLKESDSIETMKDRINEYFNKTILDPQTTNITLGKSFKKVDGNLLLESSRKLLDVNKGKEEADDKNSLRFKEIHSVDNFISERLMKNRDKLLTKLKRNLDSRNKIADILNLRAFNSVIETEFTGSSHASTTDQTNPITMVGDANRVTIFGEGGITNIQKVTEDMRSLHPSHFGFLDPTQTPEGENIGAVLRLASGATKEGKNLKTNVYNIKTNKNESIDPIKFHDSIVALPDQFEFKDKKINWIAKKVKAMHKGVIGDVPTHKIEYVILKPNAIFSSTTNLIPFLQNDHGNRITMASKQMEQALPLKNREVPLVVPTVGTKGSMYDIMGKNYSFQSPVDGTVKRIEKEYISIKDSSGKTHKVNIYNQFPLMGKISIDSYPAVKVGDTVKKGQLIADTNYTKGGILAQGVNLRTALIPYKGLNFEDGVVITQSAASKLTSEHTYHFTVDVTKNTVLDINKFRRLYPTTYKSDVYANFDNDGIIKKGSKVFYKDPVALILRKDAADEEDIILGRLRKSFVKPFKNKSIEWDRESEGTVIEVTKGNKNIKIYIKTEEQATIGDKITGRHGNKGIITKVIPDQEAPHDASGKPVEVLFNPHGIISRMNVGQMLEGAASKVALKTGKPIRTINFQPNKNYLDGIKDLLKKNNVSEKEELFDPETGKSLGEVFVGHPHTLKLYKQSTTNFGARSRDKYDLMTLAPSKGGETGGKSLDLLTFYSMLAHGATENLREMATYKAEKNDEFWSAIQNNATIPPPKPTYAFNKFINMLKASGVNVEKKGTEMVLGPLTNKEILKASSGALSDPSKMFRSGKNLVDEPGGIFDPVITGGKSGKRWSHIPLSEPIANPIFETPIKKLLNLSKDKYEKLIQGKLKVNEKGKIDENGKYLGGNAIKRMLKNIDVNNEIATLTEKLKTAKKTELDTINNKLRLLKSLKNLNMKPDEAYILENIPVIPPTFRPVISNSDDGTIRAAPVNWLYRTLGLSNSSLKDLKKWTVEKDGFEIPESEKAEARKEIYNNTKALFGLIDPKNVGIHQKDVKGFISEIAGTEPKTGFFQSKIMKRKQDVVGRGTIIPDPDLHVDEIAMPEKMAWKLYNEFIIQEFRKKGFNLDNAHKHINDKTNTAKAMLGLAMADRPVLLNRAPSLHKFSIMAFKPKLTDGTAIKIPPLVVKGFNADFDGDTMNVHVPVTQKAVAEAEKMFPSKNLYNPGSGVLMMTPTEAAALGIYKMSKEKEGLDVINKIIKKHIPNYPLVTEVLNKKQATQLFDEIGKKYPNAYDKVIDDLRIAGDTFAYKVGSSVYLKDIEPISKERNKIISQAESDAKKIMSSKLTNDEKTQRIEKIYTSADKKIEKILDRYFKVVSNNFNEMVESGAKGKFSQLKQIIATPTLVKDYKDNLILTPIKNSLSEGLSISDFWNAQQGNRKTMIDKGLQTSEPGAFNKEIMATTISMVVTAKDCKTREGIMMNVNDSDSLGRYLSKSISVGGKNIASYNDLFDTGLQTKLIKERVKLVELRTPLKCKISQGVCAKCYGINQDGKEHELGDNVGAIAGQSLSEPLTQMTLRCTISTVIFKYKEKIYSRSMQDIFDIVEGEIIQIDGKETKKLDKAFVWDKNGWIKAEYIQRHRPETPLNFIKTDTGDSILCQDNHPIFTYKMPKCSCGYHNHTTRFENKGYTVFECTKCKRVISIPKNEISSTEKVNQVRDLTEQDYLWISKRTPKHKIDDLDIEPYIIGFYLAEGNVRTGNGTDSYKDKAVATILNQYEGDIKKHVESILDRAGYKYGSHKECSTIYNPEFSAKMKKLCPGYAHEKRMNFDFMFMSEDYLADILSGAIDGDGYIAKVKDLKTFIGYYTSSFILAQQICMICYKLGISYNISSYFGDQDKNEKQHRTQMYSLEIRIDHNSAYLLKKSYKVSNALFEHRVTYKNPIAFGPAKVRTNKPIKTEYDFFTYDIKTSSGSFIAGFIRNHNTFHTGSILGTGPVGYERISALLSMPKVVPGKATLAQESGIVKKIEPAPAGGFNLFIDNTPHYIPKGRILKVKVGNRVRKGDALCSGIIKPQELHDLRGLEPTQRYLVDELDSSYSSQGVKLNKKMYETIVRAVTDSARVTNAGGHPSYVDGDIAPHTRLKYFNEKGRFSTLPLNMAIGNKLTKNIATFKKGQVVDGSMVEKLKQLKIEEVPVERDPIQYQTTLVGMPNMPFLKKDWLSQMGYQHIKDAVLRGASEGWTSNISNPATPVPAYAYGAMFGLGKPREL